MNNLRCSKKYQHTSRLLTVAALTAPSSDFTQQSFKMTALSDDQMQMQVTWRAVPLIAGLVLCAAISGASGEARECARLCSLEEYSGTASLVVRANDGQPQPLTGTGVPTPYPGVRHVFKTFLTTRQKTVGSELPA